MGAGEAEQATLRACAEAFLTPSVIVCEGKTEIGLVRGLDLFQVENGKLSMTAHAVYYADGGGSQAIGRALVFSKLGYRTALFRDGDQPITPEQVEILKNAKIEIVEWAAGHATEDVLFASIPSGQIQQLLTLAVSRCGKDAVDAHIKQASNAAYGVEEAQTQFNDVMRPILATVAKKKGWFKDVEPGEIIGREIVGPHLAECDAGFVSVLTKIETWVKPQAVTSGTEG